MYGSDAGFVISQLVLQWVLEGKLPEFAEPYELLGALRCPVCFKTHPVTNATEIRLTDDAPPRVAFVLTDCAVADRVNVSLSSVTLSFEGNPSPNVKYLPYVDPAGGAVLFRRVGAYGQRATADTGRPWAESSLTLHKHNIMDNDDTEPDAIAEEEFIANVEEVGRLTGRYFAALLREGVRYDAATELSKMFSSFLAIEKGLFTADKMRGTNEAE